MFLSSEGVGKPLRMASKCLVPDSQVSMRKSMLAGRMNHTSSPQKNMEIGIVKLLSGRCHSAGEFALRTFKRLGTFFCMLQKGLSVFFTMFTMNGLGADLRGGLARETLDSFHKKIIQKMTHCFSNLTTMQTIYADHLRRPFQLGEPSCTVSPPGSLAQASPTPEGTWPS